METPLWVMIVGSVCFFLMLVLAAGGAIAATTEIDERDVQPCSDGKAFTYKALCPCCASEWTRFRWAKDRKSMPRFAYCPTCERKIKN